jgi:hypothetical protein
LVHGVAIMKKLFFRIALLIGFGYAFEALLLCIGRLGVPGLSTMIGISQIPSIAWAIGNSPENQRGLLLFMFVVQGSIFSVIAIGVWFMSGLGRAKAGRDRGRT